ncbi:MAG: hypothetical protein IKD02_02135 [Clostridia bacterium]|nr:hypothetical protein [Clostridia bacterium]
MKTKNKTIKVLVATLLSVVMLFGASIGVVAADNRDDGIMPLWTSISTIELDVAFSGDLGNALGAATKQSTASAIEGTLVLYKWVDNDWEYVDEWYNYRTRGTLIVSGDFTAEPGVTYKAEFTVTAYTGSVGETETVEYSNTCPSN